MRYAWDLFRWRFVAAYYIAGWVVKGATMKDQPADTRLQMIEFAWRVWRSLIMFRHEKDKYITTEEWSDKL